MMSTSAHEIAHVLLQAGAVLLRPQQPFTFASGLRSPVYCDNRLLLGNVAARRLVTAAFAAQCTEAEVLAGPATAGIPWAALAAEQCGLPMCYVRGAAKGHGRAQQIEGAEVAGKRVVVLEDTISTGGSALQAIAALREAGAEVLRCVCIFTYDWPEMHAAFDAASLPLVSLSTLAVLLDVASNEGTISPEQRVLVERWATNPKEWQG